MGKHKRRTQAQVGRHSQSVVPREATPDTIAPAPTSLEKCVQKGRSIMTTGTADGAHYLFVPFQLTQRERREILRCLGLPDEPYDGFFEAIQEILSDHIYFQSVQQFKAWLVREKLTTLRGFCEKLELLLESLFLRDADTDSNAHVSSMLLYLHEKPRHDDFAQMQQRILALINDLTCLKHAAERSIHTPWLWPRGPQEQRGRAISTKRLEAVYVAATGKRALLGQRFHNFVTCCLRIAGALSEDKEPTIAYFVRRNRRK